MNKKNNIIELWRFIASIIIVLHHSSWLGLSDYHFDTGWIFVEFFLILTGYFTMKHFADVDKISLDEMSINSFKYTAKKFLPLLPYTTISLLFVGISRFFIINHFDFNIFTNMLLEMTLITRGEELIHPFWYLFALIIVFPIFCCLCQIRSKNFLYLISVVYILLYYNKTQVGFYIGYPDNIFRVLGGLSLGCVIYGVTSIIKNIKFNKMQKVLLTFFEEALLITVVILTYLNKTNFMFMLFCLAISITIMLSGITYTKEINVKLFRLLGKISMIIYCINIPIAETLRYLKINEEYIQITCCFACTITALFLYYISKKIIKYPL